MAIEIKDTLKKNVSNATTSGNTIAKPVAGNAAAEALKNTAGNVQSQAGSVAKDVVVKQMQANQTPDYSIDYNDQRFQNVEAQRNKEITDSNQMYDQMRQDASGFYQGLKDEADRYAQDQKKLQQEQTDFAIEQVEQQKQFAEEDYKQEQSAAYVDWQKQSGKYGIAAEQMAAQGLQGTGYSESSKVAMYTAYQNRVALARQSFERNNVEYDNMIKEARLANNSALAQIAHDAWLAKAEYALQGFQYGNDLLMASIDRQDRLNERYDQKWRDVLDQMNYENEFAENIRQYNEGMQFEREKEAADNLQWKNEFDENIRQYNEGMQFEREKEATDNDQWLKTYNEGIRQYNQSLAEEKRQYNKSLAEEKRQYNTTLKKSNGSSVKTSGGTIGEINEQTTKEDETDAPKPKAPVKKPTNAQIKKYFTLEQNIGNMMMKGNVSEERKTQMEDYILKHVKGEKSKDGKEWIIKPNSITDEQYERLISLIT